MIAGVPPRVLIARLAHELETARLALAFDDHDKALHAVRQCLDLAEQIRKAV